MVQVVYENLKSDTPLVDIEIPHFFPISFAKSYDSMIDDLALLTEGANNKAAKSKGKAVEDAAQEEEADMKDNLAGAQILLKNQKSQAASQAVEASSSTKML